MIYVLISFYTLTSKILDNFNFL